MSTTSSFPILPTWVLRLFFWTLLIPCAFDGTLALRLGHHHLRFVYIACAFLVVLFLFAFFREGKLKMIFKTESHYIYQWFFLAFLAFGAYSAMTSVYPSRAVPIWSWTLGTLMVLPFLARQFHQRLGSRITTDMVWFGSVLSIIVIYDASVSSLGHASWALGRLQDGLRPHAFKQEPAYLAALLLTLIVSVRSRFPELSETQKKLASLFFLTASVATILTASRLAWLGVIPVLIFLSFDLFLFLKNRQAVFSRKGNGLPLLVLSLLLGLMVVSTLFYSQKKMLNHFYQSTVKSVSDRGHSGSLAMRLWSAQVAVEVWKEHFWFGAGPGTAGAAIVETHNEAMIHLDLFAKYGTDFPKVIPQEDLDYIKNNPLSNNLYTELLSEWGLFGTFLFFIGFAFFVLQNSNRPFLIFITYAIVWLVCESLPRFDLWLMVSLAISAVPAISFSKATQPISVQE
jgi:hypothetical protein